VSHKELSRDLITRTFDANLINCDEHQAKSKTLDRNDVRIPFKLCCMRLSCETLVFFNLAS
jgi:hypothetical protein